MTLDHTVAAAAAAAAVAVAVAAAMTLLNDPLKAVVVMVDVVTTR